MYTPFIADYIGSYGRDLSNLFCIRYTNTYTWCLCKFTQDNLDPFLCDIPDKYKIKDFENGCYW